jgi:hypothetical protein
MPQFNPDIKQQNPLSVKEKILHEHGTFKTSEICELLNIDQQSLESLREEGNIFGLPLKSGEFLYPQWQIVDKPTSTLEITKFREKNSFPEYAILPGIQQVIKSCNCKGLWAVGAFMYDKYDIYISEKFYTNLSEVLIDGEIETASIIMSTISAPKEQGQLDFAEFRF